MDGPEDTIWVNEHEDLAGSVASVVAAGFIVIAGLLLITCAFTLVNASIQTPSMEEAFASNPSLAIRGAISFALAATGAWLLRRTDGPAAAGD